MVVEDVTFAEIEGGFEGTTVGVWRHVDKLHVPGANQIFSDNFRSNLFLSGLGSRHGGADTGGLGSNQSWCGGHPKW